MNKFSQKIYVVRDPDNDDVMVTGESLNAHAVIGQRRVVAEYELKRVVEITCEARVAFEIGQ